jgi:hypothetical protein
MCKICEAGIPNYLCRSCNPHLNQVIKVKAEPKRKKTKWREERMVTTVKQEADIRWRNWLPTKTDRVRPTRRQFAKIVRDERGMV